MEHGKHKMKNGHMMSDSAMKKRMGGKMPPKGMPKGGKKKKKGGRKGY